MILNVFIIYKFKNSFTIYSTNVNNDYNNSRVHSSVFIKLAMSIDKVSHLSNITVDNGIW